MKERFLIFAALAAIVVLMVGLNAASYKQKAKAPDSEFAPNRSTFNPGATGSMAFFTLLAESGRKVMRWQRPPADLQSELSERPGTFVMVGPARRELDDAGKSAILSWVAEGGRLVLIDRRPDPELVVTSSEWAVSVSDRPEIELAAVDPANQQQMTAQTVAARPVQPTILTAGVNAVQPSRFAASIRIERHDLVDLESLEETSSDPAETGYGTGGVSGTPADPHLRTAPDPPAPAPVPARPVNVMGDESSFTAPVVHVLSAERNLLVDMPYGAGNIVVLSDPYIISNGGIGIADNAHLAMNIAGTDGLIAFDEYHHGFGSGTNRVIEYFEGTPVIAILLQIAAIAAFALYSRGRRFARPVPEAEADRLTKLEYVSAMAELQQRTGAFDLAMENIYGDFRRRVARHFGVDGTATSRRDLAVLIGERLKTDPAPLEELMFKCEDIIHGEPAGKRQVMRLTEHLRDIESRLGLIRSGRARI